MLPSWHYWMYARNSIGYRNRSEGGRARLGMRLNTNDGMICEVDRNVLISLPSVAC
jgi:hypothetical protein